MIYSRSSFKSRLEIFEITQDFLTSGKPRNT